MKNRLNKLENPAPRPPTTLSASAATLWRRLQTDYGIVDSGGLTLLSTACEAYGRMKQAQQMLDKEGLVVRDRHGQAKPHPALKIEYDNRAQLLSSLKMLSLDIEPLAAIGRPGGPKAKLQLTRVK